MPVQFSTESPNVEVSKHLTVISSSIETRVPRTKVKKKWMSIMRRIDSPSQICQLSVAKQNAPTVMCVFSHTVKGHKEALPFISAYPFTVCHTAFQPSWNICLSSDFGSFLPELWQCKPHGDKSPKALWVIGVMRKRRFSLLRCDQHHYSLPLGSFHPFGKEGGGFGSGRLCASARSLWWDARPAHVLDDVPAWPGNAWEYKTRVKNLNLSFN